MLQLNLKKSDVMLYSSSDGSEDSTLIFSKRVMQFRVV
jgi:hypothetical protein